MPLTLFVCATLVFGCGALAAERSRIATVLTRDAAAFAPGGAAERLTDRAREKGQVRVIVGLAMKMRFAARLSAADAEAQRGKLRATQDRVLERGLGQGPARNVARFAHIPYVSAFVDAEQLARLLRDPDVVSLQEDVPVPPLLEESLAIIHAPELFKQGVTGLKHAVAVLDTGATARHPMLKGKVESEACYSTENPDEGLESLCQNQVEVDVGRGSAKSCPLLLAGCDHGTHVSSIAVGDSGTFDGVARDADLVSIKVFTRFENCGDDPAPCVRSFSTDQIKALERVLEIADEFNVDAVNMSLGGGAFAAVCDAENAALKSAVDNLREAGIVTVVAAGNDGKTGMISAPACVSTVVAVGNSTDDDLVATSSNHSSLVKLMAPGTKIVAAVPPRDYGAKTGTSMAAPHVAGAFALMRDAKPTASVDNILAALICSGKTVHQREEKDGVRVEITPQRPRIDVLGAYGWLRAPPNNRRGWQFSAASDARDWSPVLGQWKVVDGVYRQQPVVAGWVGSSFAACSRALTIEATMTRDDPGKTVFSNSGLFFRATVNHAAKTLAGYFVAYNKCPTNASGVCTNGAGDPPGQALFYTVTYVDLIRNQAFGSLRCSRQAKVNADRANTIKVVSDGPAHRFFLNGKLVCDVNDATFPTGSVMLGAFLASSGGHAYQVDKVSTRSTDSGPSFAPEADIDPASAVAATPIPAGLGIAAVAPALQAAR